MNADSRYSEGARLVGAVTIAGVTAMAAGQARGQGFSGLGTLPGDTDSLARGVSADGSVVVGAIGSSGGYGRAFRWTATAGMSELGAGSVYAFAEAVSGDGLVAVGIGNPDGTGPSAVRWTTEGVTVRLGNLPGWGYNAAYAANADGSVISGYGYGPGGKRAARWTGALSGGGVMQSLGTLSSGCGLQSFSQGYGGISADGSVISGDGSADVPSCSGHAFRWVSNGSGGTMQDLGHLPGQFATDSLAFGLSSDGLVVVGSSQAGNADQAFRWSAGTGMQDIGSALTSGDDPSQANAASADGSAVVGWATVVAANDMHAFLWTPALGTVDLNIYLPTLGITIPVGWVLNEANAISADGRTIVGTGTNPLGYNEVWRVTLGPAPCYANCDGSTAAPVLNVADFTCFLQEFAAGHAYANCDGSTTPPVLNVADFTCFLQRFAAGCP